MMPHPDYADYNAAQDRCRRAYAVTLRYADGLCQWCPQPANSVTGWNCMRCLWRGVPR